MTVEEPGLRGQRSTFENILIDEISRKSNTLKDGILQMTWDSFEIIKAQKDDYDGLCVQSCNKWWGKLFFIGMEGVLDTQDHLWWRNASDGVAQATLKQLCSFVAAFWSCFVPVWTFLWLPAHLMDKLCFYCLLYFNKPKLLTLMLLSVVNVKEDHIWILLNQWYDKVFFGFIWHQKHKTPRST